jgi:hypothetical protein
MIERFPPSEKLLLLMHNTSAMRPEAAKTANELASISETGPDSVSETLKMHEDNGYVRSYWDNNGAKRFYLSETGIIRVCSFFT